ncbi:hypothetical protein BOX15_Mlig003962g5, partial [Macrostomum lignano]
LKFDLQNSHKQVKKSKLEMSQQAGGDHVDESNQQQQQQQQPAAGRGGNHDFLMYMARLGTLVFTVLYLFTSLPAWHTRALLAYGVASALKLHTRAREAGVTMNMDGMRRLLAEDNAHYLLFVLIFAMAPAPVTLALVPVFLFALLHSTVYTRQLVTRQQLPVTDQVLRLTSYIDRNTRTILTLIALNEIFLMPAVILMLFTGYGSIVTPFLYYKFLILRYCSNRNPYNRTVFRDLRIRAEQFCLSPSCPQIGQSIIRGFIAFVLRFCPPEAPQNYVY